MQTIIAKNKVKIEIENCLGQADSLELPETPEITEMTENVIKSPNT